MYFSGQSQEPFLRTLSVSWKGSVFCASVAWSLSKHLEMTEWDIPRYLTTSWVSSSSSVFPAISLGLTFFGEIFTYVTVFRGSHIPSSWNLHGGGCVFVTGIHPSRTWMSGSFESIQWNVCVHRLDLGLYSHPKEFLGNGVRTHSNSMEILHSTGGSEEGRTRGAALRRTVSPTHYWLSYSSHLMGWWSLFHSCHSSSTHCFDGMVFSDTSLCSTTLFMLSL